MCCFKHLLLHSVYINCPRSRLLKAIKSRHELFHRPRLRSHPGFLHLKFLCTVATTTTQSLELPEYWQSSDFVQNKPDRRVGLFQNGLISSFYLNILQLVPSGVRLQSGQQSQLMRICCSVASQRNLTSMLLRLFAERQEFTGCNVDAWNKCWTIAFSQF